MTPTNMPDIFTPITPLQVWVQKVLPLVYDDSLSYYEVLSKVADKLNELIEIVNVQGEGIYGYIDEQFANFKTEWNAELETKLAVLTNTINQNNEIINGRLDTFQADYTSQISASEAKLTQQIAELAAQLDAKVATFTQLVATTDNANRSWTEAKISQAINALPDELPPVICPVDGQLESVQVCINHIWDFLNKNSLTANEYDALDLSADAYDAFQLTATQYDQTGKLLLDPSSIKED